MMFAKVIPHTFIEHTKAHVIHPLQNIHSPYHIHITSNCCKFFLKKKKKKKNHKKKTNPNPQTNQTNPHTSINHSKLHRLGLLASQVVVETT